MVNIIRSHRTAHRTRAQGMVEFALALPIILLLIFGIIEFARLLVTYTAVYTASRESVRYAVAFGMSGAGVPYWKDCQGIRDTAVRVGGYGGVQADDLEIRYDSGLVEMPAAFHSLPTCEDIAASGYEVKLGDRVIVQVISRYEPIVPLVNMTGLNVSSSTARTFLIAVDVRGTPLPTQTRIHSRTPTLDKTATSQALTETAFQATLNANETATQVSLEKTLTATYSSITPGPTDTSLPTLTPSNTPIPPTATLIPEPSNTPVPSPTLSPTATNTPAVNCDDFTISFANEQILARSYITTVVNNYPSWVYVRGFTIWWPNSEAKLTQFVFGVTEASGLFTQPYTYYWVVPTQLTDNRDLALNFDSEYDGIPAINVMLNNDCFYTTNNWPTPTPEPPPTETANPPMEGGIE